MDRRNIRGVQPEDLIPVPLDINVDREILASIPMHHYTWDSYYTLLALDASAHQINGLPLSTAQGDFDQACAICLDTPTTGDKIRHLPCLHKFHKDCIDPWLWRKTSCPVCRSSIK